MNDDTRTDEKGLEELQRELSEARIECTAANIVFHRADARLRAANQAYAEAQSAWQHACDQLASAREPRS